MRMFCTYFLILIVMFSTSLNLANAQGLVPDPNLAAAIREQLDLAPGTDITETHLEDLTQLGANNMRIADLTGLEHATNLWVLSLDNNQIRDLTPLKGLTNLNVLEFNNNQIRDLTPLKGLTDLRFLEFAYNQIRDLTPLKGLNLLLAVNLKGNPIDISQLAALPPDTKLDVSRVHLRTPIYFLENVEVYYQATGRTRRKDFIRRADSQEISHGFSRPDSLNIVDIALDISAGKIYWTGDRTGRANLDGSNIEDWTGHGAGIALDTSRGKVYWAQWPNGEIRRTNLDGSNPETIVTGLGIGSPWDIALDVSARKVYWTDYQGRIRRANLDGTDIENVLTGVVSLNSIALDLGSRKIYWADTGAKIQRANLDGTDIEDVLTGVVSLNSIALDLGSRKIYWADTVSGKIQRANLDGSNVEAVVTGRERLSSIALAPVTPRIIARTRTPSSVAMDRVVFNEIRNASEDKNDWIELKNISEAPISLADWEISIVPETEVRMFSKPENAGEDTDIVAFPDYTLPAGGVLLIVNTDPSETDLIRGQDLTDPERKPDVPPQYLVAPKLILPDAPYLLILRSARDKNGKPEAFEDLAGNYFRATTAYDTRIWPLRDTVATGISKAPLTRGKAWKRVSMDKRGYEADAWAESGYQAGLGYRPGVPMANGLGTPGYPDGSIINDVSAIGRVSFSEVMFASKGGLHSLSQWIELYNNSDTEVVNLKGWSLEIEVRDADGSHRHGMISLNDLHIMPNQTALIVTWSGRNSGHFPEERVYNFFAHHSDTFEQNRHRNQVLSSEGFSLKLSDADGTLVDVAGNLDGARKTEDAPAWALPSGVADDNVRSSILRRYEDRIPLDGKLATSWRRAAEAALKVRTYWGKKTDIGGPGYKHGGILPVGLSHFRASRSETGVVVRWTTASETDNAGFNILRSETRGGEFLRINAKLIEGAGTTSEARQYTWRDTTARPNVAYYYQLEDVSFSGDRQRLAKVRLKGHVTASDKLTTVWGALKSQE